MIDRALSRALGEAVGTPVARARTVGGGDINQAYRVELTDARTLFVKTHAKPLPGMYECEAAGLRWLAEAEGLRTPEVIAVREAPPAFLALEWVDPARKATDHDERLGRGLAALHRTGAPAFGLDHDNYIAVLPQRNTPCETWGRFYAERRLEPQLARAADGGLASPVMRSGFEKLFARLSRDPDSLCGPPEPPARLHGDLWGGNAVTDERGQPCLIDPAVYGGHREIDLAMMRLFGGFSPRCFAAYDEAYPLAAGHGERVAFYQLYPLMVHVNLFGHGYVGSVERALSRLI